MKAMNLTPLAVKTKFKPMFTKNLKDPQNLIDQGVLKEIDFDFKEKKVNK
jgi:hypothetical protein